MIMGGQGRSPESLRKDASGIAFSFLLAAALAVMLTLRAMLRW